jgi:hypothetical protein
MEHCPWLNARQMESLRIDDHADGEGAAGKALTVSAVARVYYGRRLSDLVAKPAALAAASLRKYHLLGANDELCQIAEIARAVLAFGPHLGADSSLGLVLSFGR